MCIVKESVSKTIHVWCLDEDTKNEIRFRLEKQLSQMFCDNELDEYIECGMDSRLCDLEETIDIYNLKTVKVY